jgi:hypothetical protein
MYDANKVNEALKLKAWPPPADNPFDPWPNYYFMAAPQSPAEASKQMIEVAQHIQECKEAVRAINTAMLDQERAYRQRARTEKGEGNKLAFSNDPQRADAVADWCGEDSIYQTWAGAVELLENTRAHLEIYAGHLERLWKLLRYDYELATVGRRDGGRFQ